LAYEVASRWSEPSLTVGLLHRATQPTKVPEEPTFFVNQDFGF